MKIIGHEKNLSFLERSIEAGSVSHAYLFTGPEHLGKFSVAIDFAKKLIGEKEQSVNPDLIIISPEKEEKKGVVKEKDIKIEKIRELEKELSLSPYFKKRKVAIIEKADRLTISAQNALLKTLEEPAPHCVIILIASDRDKILPTIQSRCLTRKFTEARKAEIEKIVPAGARGEQILFWSMGRVGLTMRFLEDKVFFRKKIEKGELLTEIIRADLTRRFKEAEILSKDPDELIETLGTWVALLRDNVIQGERLPLSKETSLDLIDEIEKIKVTMRKTNSNVRTLLENLFLKF
jgi:DNA polymerase III subunit delta'